MDVKDLLLAALIRYLFFVGSLPFTILGHFLLLPFAFLQSLMSQLALENYEIPTALEETQQHSATPVLDHEDTVLDQQATGHDGGL